MAEFKEAGKDYDKNKIGQYFSAISNEANLKGLQHGWLVFGVRNKNKEIVGSDYRNTKGLDTLKQEISVGTTGGISFIEIYEVYPEVRGEKKRVILFQIPAATTATPTGWNDHFYGRNGESLGALSVEELDRIRGQEKKDWSKQIIPEAKIEYLDKEAITLARENYKKKMNKPYISNEVDQMTDEQFLTKLKLIINGKITNAAMLLLGREDYDYLFNTVPEASWRVFDSRNEISDYEIFKIPYITLSERLFGKIRNLTYRYMPNQLTLFPTETKQYDMWLLRELLNNCIAHSEYTLGGRIYLNEFEDKIILTNPGSFLPGKIEKVLDENYSQILFANPDFDLETVFLIDCVQKRIKIDKEAIKHLRKLKVIEGKSPNIFLSASVSETIGEQSQYVKNKAFNDQYYRDLIVKYLEQYGSAKKRDVRELLWDKLPEVMDDKQKESKVKNLLSQMRRTGIITTDSENQQRSSWILVKNLNK